jgi:hypothetical protein
MIIINAQCDEVHQLIMTMTTITLSALQLCIVMVNGAAGDWCAVWLARLSSMILYAITIQ